MTTLEEETGDAAATELGERRLDAVRGEHLRAHRAQRRCVDFWSDDHEHRRQVEGLEQLGIERQACSAVEDDAKRLAGVRGARSEQGSSVRAVPMPTAIASDSARQRWTSSRLCSLEIQGESPGRRRGPAVERHRQLQRHQRQPGAGVLAEGLVEQPRRARLLTGGELDLNAAVAQDPGPAAGGLLTGIVGGDHDPRDPRLENRLDARRLPAGVRARLQRQVHRRPGRIVAPLGAIGQRRPLRVQIAKLGVESLADHLASPHHDSSDERIGTDSPPPALRKLKRPPQWLLIRACELGIHETD